LTHSRKDAAALLEAHGLAPRRALGQNFVVDPNTVRRIVRLAGIGPDHHVVEVGAGLGSLTLGLADTGADVIAVEYDTGLAAAVTEVVASRENVRVVEGDALQLDWHTLLASAPAWVLVANLPYNVATPMVADLLDGVPEIERFFVMVQREVAERFAASPGTKAYGALSVKVAYWATARLVGDVPPTVFLPRPKVMSSLVEITRRPTPAVGPEVPPERLFTVVRAGFAHRRKTLHNSLAGVVDDAAFEAAGVSPSARAEQLDVAAWGRLAAVPT
jgi:16S rRNA (adenine1518-N6/adenine1519-N6)-dimethyltransferase